MANRTMGEMISTLRKEKGMTQKDLAEQLNITDKAVSKWERDLAYPDTGTLPRLAGILEVSIEDLLNAKAVPVVREKKAETIVDLILKVIPVAMGVAVAVTSLLGTLDAEHGLTMLGVGLACIGISSLNHKR